MRSILVVVALASALAACTDDRAPAPTVRPASSVVFETDAGTAIIRVDLAETAAEHRRGLQGVTDLPAGQGMAFVFPEPTTTTFWMKDTLIPLSIAFVGAEGRVIAIREMEPCRSDHCPSVGAGEPFVLAIEANRGWFDDAGVEVGDRARLRGASSDG